MSKLKGELTYKDWCILKHALKEKVDIKEKLINSIDENIRKIKTSESSFSTYDEMNKEFQEEKATLERVTEIVENFKRDIEK